MNRGVPTSGLEKRIAVRDRVARFQSLIALLLMIAAMTLAAWLSGRQFLTEENLMNILRQISINVCLSIGMTLVILTGGIDLSVGSVLAFTGAVMAGLLKNGIEMPTYNTFIEFTPSGAIGAGLLVGLLLGLFNGVMITRFRIPPFVATLGMLSVARGLTKLWTGGFPITGLGKTFGFIGAGMPLGVPTPVWISAALVVAFYFVSRETRLGRYVYAVGGNERAALLSGVRINRVKLAVYSLAGLLSAVAGLIATARIDSATPIAGFGYELDSIAAVVIGGTSLSGGRGSILGTVIGCLIIGVLNSGLNVLGVSPFWQEVVKGLVILAAVAIDRMRARAE